MASTSTNPANETGKTFEATDHGIWGARRPVLPLKQKNYALYVKDPNGPVTLHGERLRPAAWDNLSAGRDRYVVEQVPPQPPADRRLQSYDERLASAPLEPISADMCFAAYVPNLGNLPDETVDQRINRLKAAVRRAGERNADVFIGPEYFFTKNTNRLNDTTINHAYTAAEYARVKQEVNELVNDYPSMLIVPGTILWKDDNQKVRNSAFVYPTPRSGAMIQHDKNTSHDDEAYAQAAGGEYLPGPAAYSDFRSRGLRARYDICSDITADSKKNEGKEMHLTSGYNFGGGTHPRTHRGGVELVADGNGMGRVERFSDRVPMSQPNDGDLVLRTMRVTAAAFGANGSGSPPPSPVEDTPNISPVSTQPAPIAPMTTTSTNSDTASNEQTARQTVANSRIRQCMRCVQSGLCCTGDD